MRYDCGPLMFQLIYFKSVLCALHIYLDTISILCAALVI